MRARIGGRRLLVLLAVSALASCTSLPPDNAENICDIFDEKRSWYDDVRRSEKRWGTGIPVIMAMMYQESSFRPRARPPREWYLGFIPGPRKSNAFGFAQVKTMTWREYQRNSGNHWSSRTNFADAVDFMGWYNQLTHERNGIAKDDAYNLYLAYHQGHGGFERGSYKQKRWLMNVARKVDNRAERFRRQLNGCESRFKGPWWWPLS